MRRFQNEVGTIIRYGLVGFLNTGVFALSAYLLSRGQLHYAIYTALAYIIAIMFSFWMNALFTFRKSGHLNVPMFGKFILVAVCLLLLVEGIQAVLIEIMNIGELPAVVAGMIFYTGVGYVLNRLWVFAKRPQQTSD